MDIKIIYIFYTFSQSLKRSRNRTFITKWRIHCTLGSRTTTTLFLMNYNPRKEYQNLTTICDIGNLNINADVSKWKK